MESYNNKCHRCQNFIRYYIRSTKNFQKTMYGLCCSKNEHVKSNGGCKNYKEKPHKKLSPIIAYQLDELLMQITAIRETIEETAKK